jgi:hypothetical protein
MKVIEKCRVYGMEKKYLEGVLYAYIELASFLCINLGVEEDRSKTPREFCSQVSGARGPDLAVITHIFEKAKYAQEITPGGYADFLRSLIAIAEKMREASR